MRMAYKQMCCDQASQLLTCTVVWGCRTDTATGVLFATLPIGCHAGLNNAFLINTRHEFARVYNDNSVLENRHVSLLYTLLANEPHADIFTDLEDQKWKDMRKLIINCIVHTDMVHHFPMVSKVWPSILS